MLTTISPDDVIKIPPLSEFGAEEYLESPDLRRIGKELLETHNEFVDLQNVSIKYLWKKEGGTSKGRPIPGKIVPVSGVWTFYHKEDFLLWIAADHLQRRYEGTPHVPRRAVEAAVFGRLCYLSYDPEKGSVSLKGPEFSGFLAELELYSDVHDDMRRIKETVQQLPLFGVQGEA